MKNERNSPKRAHFNDKEKLQNKMPFLSNGTNIHLQKKIIQKNCI